MTFWEVFKELCDKSGKRPNPVGKEIGVSSATIAKWKAGSVPNGETLVMIADYFGCSTDYLLGRVNEPTATVGEENSCIQPELIVTQTVPEIKTDGVTSEFFKVFEALDWSDKIDTMQFARDRMRKSI